MKRDLVKILGFNVDTFTFEDALSYSCEHSGQIVTINPEMISYARSNPEFSEIIKNAELIVPDGIGVELGLKILGHNVRRIAGIDLGKALIEKFTEANKTVALVGAKPEVVELAVKNLSSEVKNINIVYSHDGYFENNEDIFKDLEVKSPDLVLVALGSPKQEYFINDMKRRLPSSTFIGLGGSFDVWAGTVLRAPKFYQNIGLEWLYRTIKEPKRFKRIFPTLPLFVFEVLKEKFSEGSMLSSLEIENLNNLSKENRQNIVKMVHNAKSGHIGGSLSACDILTVLFHKCMNLPSSKDCFDSSQVRDRFVLSKGHVSPLYYSVLSQVGFIPKEELLTFRKFGSRLQGHPCLACPGVQVATGSLGQGLSMACGIAISLKLDKNPSNVFVLLGDGELQEGSVWEAFMQASHRNLNNIVAIIDKNGLQIDGETDCVKSLGDLSAKIRAFGWNVIEVDGHNISDIYDSIEGAKKSDKPTAIIAKTVKGKGVSFMENNPGWHGKAPSDEEFELAMAELK